MYGRVEGFDGGLMSKGGSRMERESTGYRSRSRVIRRTTREGLGGRSKV